MTYLKTIRTKVWYQTKAYEVYVWADLRTIRAKVVMFGVKLKLMIMNGRFRLTYFYDLLTYLD
jgi:hypothetical protein